MKTHLIALFATFLAGSLGSQAASVMFTMDEFTGADVRLGVKITENAGSLDFDVNILSSPGGTGDISAFWMNVTPESLVGGFSVASTSGHAIVNLQQAANAVNNLGGGANLNGGGTPAPMDLGFRIGNIGGGSQIQSTSFNLSHSSAPLDLSLFQDQNFGARVKGIRGIEDSSKLKGPHFPSRPPHRVDSTGSTLAFFGMGLAVAFGLRRRLGR